MTSIELGRIRYQQWLNGTSFIYAVYKRPSAAKLMAYDKIRAYAAAHGGQSVRITAFNNQMFSCAYITETELIYITKYHQYTYKLTDMW